MRWILPITLLALAASVLAADGVLEINQTCATRTGCFSGDAAGFPVTIGGKAGRSYRLTGDLIVPDENTDGIVVSTSDVGIDLNNFSIIRSGCEGAASSCTPASGSGSGVEITSPLNRGISVRDGGIMGMGSFGVFLGDRAKILALRVRWNRLTGIVAGDDSTVSGNTANDNGGDGLFANSDSTVSGNTAKNNGGNGILVGSGATVQRNTVLLNGGYGLNFIGNGEYRENVIASNKTGTVIGIGVNLGDNYCIGTGVVSASCP